ncbi:MAG: ABC transporter ATP-binding protein [Ancrocorticia populi]|uniref:ABC transporter ATP-binding protein n=3 Tax=Ancrocorticia populi TaxID=2175228 RepID=UPI003F918ECC
MLWTLVRKYTKPYLRLIALAVVLQLASTLATLYLPSLNARIIDEGVVQGDTAFIWRVGGLMLAVAFGQVVSAVLAVWCGSRVAMAAGRDIRTGVYQRVDSFSANDVSRFGAATLITRGTNDVQQVQLIILMGLNFMVMVPIMSIGGIIMAVQEDPGLSWLVWVSVPVLLIIVGLLVRLLMPLFTRMQGNIDSINGVMREQIMGIRVVRAFVREDHETARFTDANAVLTDTSVRIGRLFILMGPIITMVLHLATTAVLWFGGHRVDQGLVQVGSLTAFMQYLLQILVAVMMGTFMFMMFPRAVVCARRIGEVLDASSTMVEPEAPVDLEDPRGQVAFRGVSYAYPGAEAPVLDSLSFTVESGTTTAIIGATGSGKSTLVNLLPRLQDATSGEVIIDGAPVTALSRTTITESVGFVPQRPYLFSGTVRSNLHFGAPDATDEEMWHALETAQAADFVREQGGLDYAISQGGTNVSGGQRQRLCIARALVSRPRVYVFDDSFSALDVATDARLRAALPNYTEGATMIIVAQRVSTITNADQILVLENGAIAARGTHEQLLTSSTTYQEIVNSQLSEENAV